MAGQTEQQLDEERETTPTEPADDDSAPEQDPSSESSHDEAYAPLTPTTT